MESDNSLKFQQISSKLSSLAYGRSEGDRQLVNALLDDLNALDFSRTVVTNVDKAVLMINQCCSLVPTNDTFLVAKACHLISNLADKQSVRVEGRTLSVAVQWCAQSLRQCPLVAAQDVLAALEVLLRGNGPKIQEHNQAVLGVLSPLLAGEAAAKQGPLVSPLELRLSALRCLEALAAPADPPLAADTEQLQACLRVFLAELGRDVPGPGPQDELGFCRLLVVALRGVESVMLQAGPAGLPCMPALLGDALGAVKAFMLFGLPGHQGLKPARVLPAPVPVSDLPSTPARGQRTVKGVGGRTRPSRKRAKKRDSDDEDPGVDTSALIPAPVNPADVSWRTSDSDFSDAEGGQGSRIRVAQTRVRQAALQLMLTITKVTERRVLFGFWWSVLPDSVAPCSRTLVTCLLRDPSPRCRTAVLAVIWALLCGSRAYLLQAEAEHGERPGSFTPFSVSLGNILRELHRSLNLAMAAESSVLALTQLLRVLASLVQNSPYHRLQPGLLARCVRSVRSFTQHRDVNVQVAALTVLGAAVAVQPPVPEQAECLLRPRPGSAIHNGYPVTDGEEGDDDDEVVELDAEEICTEPTEPVGEDIKQLEQPGQDEQTEPSGLPWILELCLRNLGMNLPSAPNRGLTAASQVAAPVRVESLQVLGALASCHFPSAVGPHIGLVQQGLDVALRDSDESIRLHAARATELVVLAMQGTQFMQGGELSAHTPLDVVLGFWRSLLSGPLTALVQSPDQAPLRAAACDCLANIGTLVFEHLPTDQQILSFTLLFGCSSDEEALVRASAIRALGLFTLFPCLRKDIQFTLDAAEAMVTALKDDSLVVRTKASWSLGNLSDALVLNRSENCEEVPDSVLLDLLQASVNASLDGDKVRSNGVRALGNLLRLISGDALHQSGGEVVNRAVSALARNASSGSNMKVRWNACYAFGNMLRNSALYESNPTCQAIVFPALCSLVHNFRNFKVRINAALALGVPDRRSLYGTHFIGVWTALLEGLDNSEHMADFSEYKHRDALLDQICCTLCHVACLVEPEDLTGLQEQILMHQDTLRQHLPRMEGAMVPERAGIFLSAASHANQLLVSSRLGAAQRCAATMLQSLFATSSLVN